MTRARSGLGPVPLPASLLGLIGVTPSDGDGIFAGGGRLAGKSPKYIAPAATTRTRNVYGMGDSITIGSPLAMGYDASTYTSTGQGAIKFQNSSWTPYALMASECRWTLAGIFATGSLTAAQILATHVPACIAAASPGDTVVVLAGTNGRVATDCLAIHTALRAAGLHTVAVTIPPSANTANVIAGTRWFNEVLRSYAAANGIPVVDSHALFCDPTTGVFSAAYLNDNLHPNVPGYQALGYAIAAVLAQVMPTPASPIVDHNIAMASSYLPKPLATGAVLGTDYFNVAALGTSTIVAPSANAYFRGGQGYKATRNDTDITTFQWQPPTVAGGHKYRLGMGLAVALAGAASWRVQLTVGGRILWALGSANAMTLSQVATRFYSEFMIPTGIGSYTTTLLVQLLGGTAGSTIELSELTLFDLTAFGVP